MLRTGPVPLCSPHLSTPGGSKRHRELIQEDTGRKRCCWTTPLWTCPCAWVSPWRQRLLCRPWGGDEDLQQKTPGASFSTTVVRTKPLVSCLNNIGKVQSVLLDWCSVACSGGEEPEDGSWSWSPENFVLPSQGAGTEGTPGSKRRAPRLTRKQVPVAYCWNTGIYGVKLVLLKSHIQIVLQTEARVSKELNFMPLMRIVFPKRRSQNPSVQCNVLQQQAGFRILLSQWMWMNPHIQLLLGKNPISRLSVGHSGMCWINSLGLWVTSGLWLKSIPQRFLCRTWGDQFSRLKGKLTAPPERPQSFQNICVGLAGAAEDNRRLESWQLAGMLDVFSVHIGYLFLNYRKQVVLGKFDMCLMRSLAQL